MRADNPVATVTEALPALGPLQYVKTPAGRSTDQPDQVERLGRRCDAGDYGFKVEIDCIAVLPESG